MHSAHSPSSQAHALKDIILSAGRSILDSADRSPESKTFHDARYALYAIAAQHYSADVISFLSRDTDIQAMRQAVFPISCEAGVFEECMIAEQLLMQPDLTFRSLYDSYYGPTYEALMHSEMAWIEGQQNIDMSVQRIAYIGGGAMPLPALLLAQKYGCRITIVDPHIPSMQLALRLIERVGLTHLIDVATEDGQDFDYSGFTMAWLANWITDKRPIFTRMKCHESLRYVVARSATETSLSFVINDAINICQACSGGFQLAHKTPQRDGLSLMSLIFENGSCSKPTHCPRITG